VGLSALLTTTMQNMKSTLEALEDLGVRTQVKVMVGGAPVTDVFAKEIGADGYAPDASRAVTLAKSLL
jgi:5-methyltetrahydrofolate--homocysteine methyltransferase